MDSENRGFQDKWEAEYPFTDTLPFTHQLVFQADVAVIKEYNKRKHYEMKH